MSEKESDLKVFISYSTKDRAIAERLFADIIGGGAEAFQYSKTAKLGQPSWDQVLEWIPQSDVFVLLVSKSALDSGAVKEEIRHAHYWHVNKGKPDRLVPALLENVEPPITMAIYSRIDLTHYDASIGELLDQLELKKPSRASALNFDSLPDFSKAWLAHKKKHPEPSPIAEWSQGAENIVANYNVLAPPEINREKRAKDIVNILAEYSGKPASDWLKPLRYPLAAPKITWKPGKIEWNPILGAMAYVVERSGSNDFTNALEVHRGSETQYSPTLAGSYYRVKAVHGYGLDGLWSDPVWEPLLFANAGSWASKLSPLGAAPVLTLTLSFIPDGVTLTWTRVENATECILERSSELLFLKPEVIYQGPDLTHSAANPFLLPYSYRVKARRSGLLGYEETPWSNLVPAS
jgi:hypothetical protein